MLNLKKTKRPPVIKTFRDFKHYNHQSFCELILSKESTLSNISLTDNVNDQVTILTEVIKSSIDALAPYVTRTVRRPPAPWINDDIQRAINDRNNANQALKSNRNEAALQVDYKVKKKVKLLIQCAKRNYFRNKFTEYKDNSNKTWKIVKTLVPHKKHLNNNCIRPIQRTDHFNDFFQKLEN